MSEYESCDVQLGEYDGDSAEDWTVKKVTAKRELKCYECNKSIHKGELHEFVFGTWLEGRQTYHTCLVCAEIADNLGEGSRLMGCLWDDLSDQLGDIPSPKHCLSKLKTPEAKRVFSEEWLKARIETIEMMRE